MAAEGFVCLRRQGDSNGIAIARCFALIAIGLKKRLQKFPECMLEHQMLGLVRRSVEEAQEVEAMLGLLGREFLGKASGRCDPWMSRVVVASSTQTLHTPSHCPHSHHRLLRVFIFMLSMASEFPYRASLEDIRQGDEKEVAANALDEKPLRTRAQSLFAPRQPKRRVLPKKTSVAAFMHDATLVSQAASDLQNATSAQ